VFDRDVRSAAVVAPTLFGHLRIVRVARVETSRHKVAIRDEEGPEMATATKERVRVDAVRLEAFVTDVLERLGMPRDDAAVTATGLVLADLRGHESHGVSNNLMGGYVPALRSGATNPRPNIRIIQETAVTARWDGDRGMGYVVGHRVMQDVIRRAADYGTAWATVQNSRHYGMAQYYSLMAVPHEQIGLSMTNSMGAGVVPFQGREARTDTNPITVAAPAGSEPPFVLDMATTTVAGGKIANALRDGIEVPSTWALGPDGLPTTDAREAYESGLMLPLGATKEGSAHKGSGLALWVDIMSGVLSLGGFPAIATDPNGVGHFFGSWQVEAFAPLDEYHAMMDVRLRDIRTTPPAPGYDRVYYAGLPEWEAEQDNRANGVPLHPSVVVNLRELAGEMGATFELD
jgi:LDH2 family malate/lactate/ureidoglycolate dehydrogenase